MQGISTVIREKDIRNNTVIKEKEHNKVEDRLVKLEKSLKDLEKAYSLGIIPESVYSKSKAEIEEEKKKLEQLDGKGKSQEEGYELAAGEDLKKGSLRSEPNGKKKIVKVKSEEENERGDKKGEGEKIQKKIEEIKEQPKQEIKESVEKEIVEEKGKEEVISSNLQGRKLRGEMEEKEKRKNVANVLEARHIKEYNKLKENWIKDLESLKNLYEHGIIGEEEYEKSKADIEEKISKIEVLIKRELEKEELEELKDRIEKEIKDALGRGVFKEEEEKYKRDLEALENLYRRGLISREEYEEKRKNIEKEIGNYRRLIELVDAIFEKYINELNTKVENIEKETQQNDITEKEREEEEEKEEEKKGWWDKLLIALRLKKGEKEEEKNSLERRIKEIYKKGDQKFKISEMAMEIKKEVKEMLNIQQAVTYSELREKLKQSTSLDPTLKSKLIDYFNDIEVKEYLSEGKDEDVEKVYKSTLNIAQEIERFKKGKKRIKEEKKENKNKEEKKEREAKEIKIPPQQERVKEEKKKEGEKNKGENKENKEEEKKDKHESIFDKINNFFGV